ncbi:hypothetical protein L1987_20849 [Smallanthus sonchifolius]|uniref:Uncharacterized protein n=1 Tax=Smallanthus sonchifolius TaxID=185202 RepID=A0ACB9ISR9_9ASTR|nr:hypothetical protein L1987_20849 [Smallanthus sonchifolius]
MVATSPSHSTRCRCLCVVLRPDIGLELVDPADSNGLAGYENGEGLDPRVAGVFPSGKKFEEFQKIRGTFKIKSIHSALLRMSEEEREMFIDNLLFEIEWRSRYPIGGAKENVAVKGMEDTKGAHESTVKIMARLIELEAELKDLKVTLDVVVARARDAEATTTSPSPGVELEASAGPSQQG